MIKSIKRAKSDQNKFIRIANKIANQIPEKSVYVVILNQYNQDTVAIIDNCPSNLFIILPHGVCTVGHVLEFLQEHDVGAVFVDDLTLLDGARATARIGTCSEQVNVNVYTLEK